MKPDYHRENDGAGNFPQCDSPLLFRNGACAENQESKKERENETERERGDGTRSRKLLARDEREVRERQKAEDENKV